MLQSSTSIQCIFCMGHYVHISHIDDQTIGSVWTTFQLNASAKARLASPADEKSLGEKSCKVTDQRGPPGPHTWSGFLHKWMRNGLSSKWMWNWFLQSTKDFLLPHLFSLQSRTDGFFTFREIDRRDVAVVLAKSLQTLVDQSSPTTAIRLTTSFTSATIMPVCFQVSSGLSREGQQHSLPPGHSLHPGHQRQPAHLPKLRFILFHKYFLKYTFFYPCHMYRWIIAAPIYFPCFSSRTFFKTFTPSNWCCLLSLC